MENIKLIVNENATLDSLLYYASKSEEFKKSRLRSRLIFGGIIALLSILFLMFNKLVSMLFIVIGGIGFIFFPQYLNWYYKKYFAKTLRTEEYKRQIGLENLIIFNEDNIEIKNAKAEIKYLHQSFEYISETENNFFIKLKIAIILAFPKDQIINQNELEDYFKRLCEKIGIEYIDDKNWNWK